jgi:hypothetical protein
MDLLQATTKLSLGSPSLIKETNFKISSSLRHPEVRTFLDTLKLGIGFDWGEFHDVISAPLFQVRNSNHQWEAASAPEVVTPIVELVLELRSNSERASELHRQGFRLSDAGKRLWIGSLELVGFNFHEAGVVIALQDSAGQIVFAAAPRGTETRQEAIHRGIIEMYQTGRAPTFATPFPIFDF